MERWYVLHTKTFAEKRVASALDQRDLEAYLPMMPATSDKARKQQRRPLFPGYLFARFNLTAGSPANWKWIPGLNYLVSFGDVAIPVPDEVIGMVERKIRELDAARAEATSPFKPGDVVRIKDGPFADMLAVIDRACTPSKRVQILLDALDRSYKLKIVADMLEKVPESAKDGKRRLRRTRGHGRYIRR